MITCSSVAFRGRGCRLRSRRSLSGGRTGCRGSSAGSRTGRSPGATSTTPICSESWGSHEVGVSYVADTPLGRVLRLADGYAVEMPCGDWERLDETQFHGGISVNHSVVCRATPNCGYHETHDFAAAVEAAGGFKAGAVSDG